MRILSLALAMVSFSLFAQESVSFRNDREGESFYKGGSFNRAILDVRKDFDATEMISAYQSALKASPKLCVYDINQSMRGSLTQLNRRFSNFKGVVYFLREQNEIDDVVAGILLRADKVVNTPVMEKDSAKLSSAGTSEFLQANLRLVREFEAKLQTQCFDQAFQGLLSDLRAVDKKLDAETLNDRLNSAQRKKIITPAKASVLSVDLKVFLTTRKIDQSAYDAFIDAEAKKAVITSDEASKLKADNVLFMTEAKKAEGKFDSENLEALLYLARTKKIISESLYVRLEQARDSAADGGTLTLRDYSQKLRVLRTQFPLRDRNERSNFVATKADKTKMSYRQRLFENYSEVQIALMGKMITDLRRRLDSTNIEIIIHNKDLTTESIPLEPMERFRFSIKKLRSEMKKLTLNSQFSSRTPDYMDLIAASYEVSFIAGSELEQLAGLEDIWNPKKTFWEKAQVWLRAFSGVASVVIPPPYGFIPTLVLVVIEATVIKDAPNPEDNGSLF